MNIKSDDWITYMAKYESLITPFKGYQISKNLNKNFISYGISSYGYDVRCSSSFKVFNKNNSYLDPKNLSLLDFKDLIADCCYVPPFSFIIASTIEYLRIPRNVLALCVGKSTYMRFGLMLNSTPLEPEWEGCVNLVFMNTLSVPIKIYSNEGIAQVLFFESNGNCKVSYKDKKGKYQYQMKPQLGKL